MRVPRCYAHWPLEAGTQVHLDERETQHLVKVLRARVNDAVLVVNGAGREARGHFIEQRHQGALIEIGEIIREEPRPAPALELGLALTRTDAFEDALSRAIELGITAFRPVEAAHNVVRLDDRKRHSRAMRWQRLAEERLKQCERLWLAEIHEPQPLEDVLTAVRGAGGTPLVLVERQAASARPLLQALDALAGRPICFFVGPEGGWSAEEAAATAGEGAVAVTLGEAILRSETAALAALATTLAHREWVRQPSPQ